jgi:c-di-GMP-related signal transduction protein
MDAGVAAAAGWFIKHARRQSPAKHTECASQATHRARAEPRAKTTPTIGEIEDALKQDVALSLQAAALHQFGRLRPDVRGAVVPACGVILGYDKLNKWLSLLLVTASKDPMAPALMQAAMHVRARLMEVLGHRVLVREIEEHDNLFITGAFSLLDKLLGRRWTRCSSRNDPAGPDHRCAARQRRPYMQPFLELALASEKPAMAAAIRRAGRRCSG